MKRAGDLWEKIATEDAIYVAYIEARRGKRQNHSCHKFERSLGANIKSIVAELNDGSYSPHQPNCFYVYEPKKRLIEAPSFRDLVVQHALYAVIMPIFERRFISTSFACRRGYGTHKAANYVQKQLALSDPDAWILKIDCRKFFYSINHDALKRQIRRAIKCKKTLWLIEKFIDCRPDGVGVPIGNLMSQVFGLIYLNDIDQFVRRVLKIRSYCRYVDDMVMIVRSREHGLGVLSAVRKKLSDDLAMGVSKYSLHHASRGVNCFGFRTWRSRRFIRKRSLYTAKAAALAGNSGAFVSCLGHARRTASLAHLLKIAGENHDHLRLPESIRRLHHIYAAYSAGAAVVRAGDH